MNQLRFVTQGRTRLLPKTLPVTVISVCSCNCSEHKRFIDACPIYAGS